MRILIADKIDEESLSLFKTAALDFDYLPEIMPDQLLEKIPNYEALIVRSRTRVTKDVIKRSAKLRIVGRVGSGVDNIDTSVCRERKIIVVNSPEGNSQSVSEMTLGLMLALLRNSGLALSSMSNGLWLKRELQGKQLADKTVGIVGYGHIGKRVEKLVLAFGARTLIYSRNHKTTTLENLFSGSDIITLHITLTNDTRGLVGTRLLSLMKPESFLINTARAEIVRENDLYEILLKKNIAGAALDVFWQEPLRADSAWRRLENVILTPHISASTAEALKQCSQIVIKDIIGVLNGKLAQNQVI